MLKKYKVNLVLCLVVCFSLVTSVAFAGSDLDRALSPEVKPVNTNNSQDYVQYNDSSFIRNKIYSLVGTALSGNKGNTLSEELKNTARNNFRLDKDEEILYAYSTAFWDNSKKISQGCVITEKSINFVWDNDKPNEFWTIFWGDIVNCEYKDMCLYIDAIGAWKDRERIDYRKTWQVHLSYLTKTKDEMYSDGNRIAQAFTTISQYLREMEQKKEQQRTEENKDYFLKVVETFDKINDLVKNDKENELKKMVKNLDENSWIYHYAKLLLCDDWKDKDCLQEFDGMMNTWKINFELTISSYLAFLHDYELKYYESARKALFNIVDYKCEYIIKDLYGVDVSEIIKDTFYDVPYKDRKIIMPIKKEYISYYTKTFEMVDIDNLPENMIFPQGHPKDGELYVGHPFLPNKYFPMENHELELTEDKIREFCDFVEGLGATEVYVESISYIDEGGNTHTEKVRGGKLEFIGYGGIGGEVGTGNSKEFENELRKIVKIHEKFVPNQSPKLVENLYWYNQEPSWKRLYEKRMRGALTEHSETISTGQSSMVNESEDIDINGEINILGVNLGGKYSKLGNREYHQNRDVEIGLHVKFAPLNNLKKFEEKK